MMYLLKFMATKLPVLTYKTKHFYIYKALKILKNYNLERKPIHMLLP